MTNNAVPGARDPAGCAAPPPVDYRLTLPRLWLRLDLDAGPQAAAAAYWARALAGYSPPDQATARALAGDRLESAVTSACARSGRALYLPDPARQDGAANASCVLVSEVPMGRAANIAVKAVVRRVLAEVPGSRAVTVQRAPGVRIDALYDPGPGARARSGIPGVVGGAAEVLRRIEFVLAVPRDPAGRWLSLALFTPRHGRAQDLIGSFDEAVRELSWSGGER
jgi:hypothetical protein